MKKYKNIFIGLSISFIITFVLLFIFSILLVNTNINENNINLFVILISIISIGIGAVISSFNFKKYGWIYGFILAILYWFIIFLFSGIVSKDFSISKYGIYFSIFGIIFGILGGIIGVNLKK